MQVGRQAGRQTNRQVSGRRGKRKRLEEDQYLLCGRDYARDNQMRPVVIVAPVREVVRVRVRIIPSNKCMHACMHARHDVIGIEPSRPGVSPTRPVYIEIMLECVAATEREGAVMSYYAPHSDESW